MTDFSDNSADDMSEYLQAFLDETDEELETLVQALLTLEDDPREIESLNEAFRMMHSLKGSSGMMGFEGIAELAHQLENRFDQIRSGDLELDRQTMGVMLRCTDFFRTFASTLRAGGEPNQDGSELIRQLKELEESRENASTPESQQDLPQGSPPGLKTMDGGCRIRVTFQKGLQLADLKAKLIIARLSSIGEIVGSEPPIDEVQSFDDLPQFVVLLATDRSPDDVRKIVNVDGVDSIDIDSSRPGQSKPDSTALGISPPKDVATASDAAPAPDFPELVADSSDTAVESVGSPAVRQSTGQSGAAETMVQSDRPVVVVLDESEPPSTAEPSRRQVAATVRVDIDRLDRLMNLTGELVVTNARFNQIAGRISPALRNSRGANRMTDVTERIREGLARIRRIGEHHSGMNGWHRILDELDDDLLALCEDSNLWHEGCGHFAQITEAVDQLARVSQNLQQGVLETRMVPVGPLFTRFKRVIRDLSMERDKNVELIIRGEKTELDKRMIDELGDPILHLIRNSIDHGMESAEARRAAGKSATGSIVLEASHSGNNVIITVQDDGAGIDVERVRSGIVTRGIADRGTAAAMSSQEVIGHIWHPGFSTADIVTEVSGRGVGMDIVKSRIEELNGSIEVATEKGSGTTFLLRLPLTLAIIRSLMIRYRDGFFTIPIDDVREIVSVPSDQIYSVHGHQTIDVRGSFVPLTAMNKVFQWSGSVDCEKEVVPAGRQVSVNVVILQSRGKTVGLCVDELLGGADIVIKSLADNFVNIRGLSGASIMGDGNVCLMLDTDAVIEMS